MWLLKTLTMFGIIFLGIGFVVFFILNTVESPEGLSGAKNDRTVAVLELVGPIMDTKEVVAELHKYAFDADIAGLVLRIDSPGGAVGPSQEVYEAVKKLKARKPIIVSMGSVAASGGLYAAMGATKVYANAGTLTGSIGVIMQFPNFEKIANTVGLQMVTIKSGKLKDVGNPFRPMTSDESEFLQSTINSAQEQFVAAVAEGRGLDSAKVREFADGRVLTGLRAKELGLVDEIGGLHDASRAIFTLLERPLKDDEMPKLIYPADKFGQFKELLSYVGLGGWESNLTRWLSGGLFAIQQ
jgi:protease-4